MIDKITELRTLYSSTSVQELEKMKVATLRSMGYEIGVRHVEREGATIPTNGARKGELAIAIYQACEAYRRPSEEVKEEDTKKILTPITPGEMESEYRNNYEELNSLAKYFYYGDFDEETNKWRFMGLRECAKKAEIEGTPAVKQFFELVGSLRPTLESFTLANSKEGNVVAASLTKNRAEVLQRIEKLVALDPSIPEMGKYYSLFYSSVMSSFRDISRQKFETSAQNLNARQSKVIHVQAAPLLSWAKDTVVNLPETASEWRNVAIALLLLTGRRQSEIMSTAKFERTESPSHLLFSGQLKKHSGEVYSAFEIPVLGNSAEAVIEGIEWLTRHGKRNLPTGDSDAELSEAAKKAHDRSSKPLSESVKLICEKYLGNSSALIDESSTGKMRDRRTCHMMRQIYGLLVVPLFYPAVAGVSRKKNQILTEIMGHADSESSLRYTANAYDSDIEIADIEEIQALA